MKFRLLGAVLAVSLAIGSAAGCGGGNPYLDASLNPAELEGKSQEWFEKNWGPPTGKSARFFGGEIWTYFRISGGKTGPPFGNFTPTECQITLKFDKEGKLSSSSYSGC